MSTAVSFFTAHKSKQGTLRPLSQLRADELLRLASSSKSNTGTLAAIIHELSFRSTDAAVLVAKQVAQWHADVIEAGVASADSDSIFTDNGSWPVRDNWRDCRVAHLFDYFPRHNWYKHEHHPDTRLILQLKSGYPNAVQTLASIIDMLLCSGIAVSVVPGHDPMVPTSGLRWLGREVARRERRIDATAALVRTSKVAKLSQGGSRDASLHEASIEIQDATSINGKSVVLLDDVTTSGNSLQVCRAKLLASGAKRVKMLAIGKTR